MPKAKPDQVVVHRIELQDTERDILTGLSTALMFNKIADPVVKLLNDVTGTVTFLTLLAASGLFLGVSFVFAYDPDALMDPLEQFLQQLQETKDRVDAGIGSVEDAARRGPLWGTIDLVEELFGINIPDFGGGFENPTQAATNPEYNDPVDLWMGNLDQPTSTEEIWRQSYASYGSSR